MARTGKRALWALALLANVRRDSQAAVNMGGPDEFEIIKIKARRRESYVSKQYGTASSTLGSKLYWPMEGSWSGPSFQATRKLPVDEVIRARDGWMDDCVHS